MAENKTGEIVIFKTADDKVSIDVRFEGETVWLTIDDMASLFEKSRSTINEHILNIFEEGELEKEKETLISDYKTATDNLLSQIKNLEFLSLVWLFSSFS